MATFTGLICLCEGNRAGLCRDSEMHAVATASLQPGILGQLLKDVSDEA